MKLYHILKLASINFLCITLCAINCGCGTSAIGEKISPEELGSWPTLDKGKTSIQGDQLIMEEIAGADGYFLISPKPYPADIILNYKVKALSSSSVNIVLFNVSDAGATEALSLPPEGTKGQEFWTWRTQKEHYNLTFNNLSHGNTPFFFKNLSPYHRGFYHRSPSNIMETQQWYDVEIGKQGSKLWFKLNDHLIFEETDHNALTGGHLIFRISGTTGKKLTLAKIALKDLRISYP
ncbi:hypothetical protein [Spongiimicrobium salis]|uniref:hypothetical protein n=1 Tax=Spongiimicrobium salis TaxID=1667022 RepID=UPI00374DCE0A